MVIPLHFLGSYYLTYVRTMHIAGVALIKLFQLQIFNWYVAATLLLFYLSSPPWLDNGCCVVTVSVGCLCSFAALSLSLNWGAG